MDPNIIPAASIGLSLSKTQQAVDTSLLRKTMDNQQSDSNFLIQSMMSLSPNIGKQMDISA